jgi:MurNAc alpha-1-phosphate uridylyltransferase
MNPLWDKAIAAERIRGLVHDGEWFHVGSPEGLALTEARISTHRVER